MIRPRILSLIVFVVYLSGCSTTSLTTVWKSPDAPTPLEFSNIVVVCMTKDEIQRRAVEDQLVARIGADRAKASYHVLGEEMHLDKEKAKAALREAGFDGAIAMRLVDVSQETSWTPSATYSDGFSGYWGNGWSGAYSSGYMVTDTVVQVETVIYSLVKDEMIWAARSESYNPYSGETMVDEIADAAVKRLKKDGLLVK